MGGSETRKAEHEEAPESTARNLDILVVVCLAVAVVICGFAWYLVEIRTVLDPEKAEELVLKQVLNAEAASRIIKQRYRMKDSTDSAKLPGRTIMFAESPEQGQIRIWPLEELVVDGKAYGLLMTSKAAAGDKGDTGKNTHRFTLGICGDRHALSLIKRYSGVELQFKDRNGNYIQDIEIPGARFKSTKDPSVIFAEGVEKIESLEQIAGLRINNE